MKKIVNFILLTVFAFFFVLINYSTKGISTATAATTDYYANVDTSTGQKLMSSLHTIISTGTKDVGYSGLWEAYKTTDVKPGTNIIWDMYSNEEYVAGGSKQGVSYKVEGDSYNREHSVPQSWFGEKSPMKADLFHVYPTDGYVNNRRSNYLYGEVGSASYTSKNGSKLGTSSFSGYSGTVFEPIDEYKGDFARTYFYMACRYSDGISSWTSDAKYNFSDSYPYLTTYSINLFLKWNALDPVSEKETTRNDAVYSIQNNRNPFIDHPEYINIIWGGSSSTTTYNVTYNANGGTFGTSETKTYTGVTTLTIPTNPTKTGYTFVGWNTSSSATTTLTLTSGSTVSANTTYYAVWKESSSTTTYNVTFNANNGTFGSTSTTTYSGVTTLTIPSNPTRTGYTFVGWNTSSTATTALTLTNGSAVTANTTYYAVWKQNSSSSSEGTTATYTISSQTSVTPTNAPNGSSESFSNSYSTKEQLTAGQTMSLTLSGYDDLTIKSIVFSMHSNASKGSGYYSITCGSNNVATLGSNSSGVAFNDESFNGNWTTTYTNVTPSFTAFTVGSGDNIVITIGATVNSLYCQSFSITYEQANKYESLENSFKEITLLSQLLFEYAENTTSTGESGSVTYNSFSGSGAINGLSTSAEYDFSTYCNYNTSLFNIKLCTNDKANFYSNSTQIRLYHATNSNGNSLVFTGKTGVTITDVTFVASSNGNNISKTVDGNTITLQNTGSAYTQITSITISYSTGTKTTTYKVNSASIRMKYALDSNLKAKLEEYATTEGKTLKFGICLDDGTFVECNEIDGNISILFTNISSTYFTTSIGCYAAFKLGDDVVCASTIKKDSVKSIAADYVTNHSTEDSVSSHLGVLTYLKNL